MSAGAPGPDGTPRPGAGTVRRDAVDTIVAPASAPGPAQRAIVRLSGPRAHELVGAVLSVDGQLLPGRVATARLDLEGGVELDVMLLLWRAPRSVTGEDVAEVHLLGWPVLVTELVRRLVQAGARPAQRGEFTRRAVVTGRLDLAQAVAVGRLVAAADVEAARTAAQVLAGHVADLHDALADQLLSTLALIEAHVDFEEEDTEAVAEGELRSALERTLDLARRLADATAGQPAVDGETDIVLLGPPNAGKSLLFTALCPGAETTVSPVPGTTRDALEAHVVRAGRRFRVLDGPGVAPGGVGLTDLDRRAMGLFVANLPPQAVVLHVEDALAPSTREARQQRLACVGDRPVVEVRNKIDAHDGPVDPEPGVVAVSAAERRGLGALWDAVLAAAPAARAPDVATAAEREAAVDVVPLLTGTLQHDLVGSLPVVSLVLREAHARLEAEREAGRPLDEQLLDRIFSTFCIGK